MTLRFSSGCVWKIGAIKLWASVSKYKGNMLQLRPNARHFCLREEKKKSFILTFMLIDVFSYYFRICTQQVPVRADWFNSASTASLPLCKWHVKTTLVLVNWEVNIVDFKDTNCGLFQVFFRLVFVLCRLKYIFFSGFMEFVKGCWLCQGVLKDLSEVSFGECFGAYFSELSFNKDNNVVRRQCGHVYRLSPRLLPPPQLLATVATDH